MNPLQRVIHRIERLAFTANGGSYNYEALGFELRNIEYNINDDVLTFTLRSDAHGISQLWEMHDVYEGQPDTLFVYNMHGYGEDPRIMYGSLTEFIAELRATMVPYTHAAQVE